MYPCIQAGLSTSSPSLESIHVFVCLRMQFPFRVDQRVLNLDFRAIPKKVCIRVLHFIALVQYGLLFAWLPGLVSNQLVGFEFNTAAAAAVLDYHEKLQAVHT